jgi:hemoglobin/transferrin/lactoferrin receptor protein
VAAARRSGDDNGLAGAATVAGRANESLQWLITVTTRNTQGLDNMGSNDEPNANRTRPNPQTNRDNALLGKLVLRPSVWQKLVLTLEHVGKSSDTELLSSRALLLPPPTSTATRALVAGESDIDNLRRDRLTWDARYVLNSVGQTSFRPC